MKHFYGARENLKKHYQRQTVRLRWPLQKRTAWRPEGHFSPRASVSCGGKYTVLTCWIVWQIFTFNYLVLRWNKYILASSICEGMTTKLSSPFIELWWENEKDKILTVSHGDWNGLSLLHLKHLSFFSVSEGAPTMKIYKEQPATDPLC